MSTMFACFFSKTLCSRTFYLIRKLKAETKTCKFEVSTSDFLNFGISVKPYQKMRIKTTQKRRFLSSQLKSMRDDKLFGAIFLSLDSLKVALFFFSSSWQRTISPETAFFSGCAARSHRKSFPFNKQTNTFQGRPGLKGAWRVGKKKKKKHPQVMPRTKNKKKKNLAAGEERGIQIQKKRRRKKAARVVLSKPCGRVCGLESSCLKRTLLVLAPRSEKKVTHYCVCDT